MFSSPERIDRAYLFANRMRRLALEMAKSAGKAGCHIGGSFSCIEILAALYGGNVLCYDAANPRWEGRDMFIPSKAHCILSYFSALACAGFIEESELISFHEDGGLLVGHPWNVDLGLEFAGGSLGMGLAVGEGMALAARRFGWKSRVYVLLGDGECNEGSVWEAFMSAAQFGLDNVVAIVDYNRMQFDGPNDDIMSLAPLGDKLRAFGWAVTECDGHSIEELLEAFGVQHEGKPLAVVARTVKARGLPSLENRAESHHAVLKLEDCDQMLSMLEGGVYGRTR